MNYHTASIKLMCITTGFALCVLFLAAHNLTAKRERKLREVTYPAWVQLTGRSDISYDQWSDLRQKSLLNQRVK